MELEQTWTIGPAAAASGLTPKGVRLYEKRGLLPTAARTAAGYRRYTSADIAALRFIHRCRQLGLLLSEIGEILQTRRAGATPCGTVRTLLGEHVTRIDKRIDDLRALRQELVATATAPAADSAVAASFCPLIERSLDLQE